jgi:hypothetical protein
MGGVVTTYNQSPDPDLTTVNNAFAFWESYLSLIRSEYLR